MLKKIICFMFCAALTVCLCACGGDGDGYSVGSGTVVTSEAVSSSEPQSEPAPSEETSSEQESEPSDDTPKNVSITISAAGDCTLGKNQKQGYSGSFDEVYDKNDAAFFFKNVKDIFENDDFTIVNLEGTLTNSTDIQTTYYNYRLGEELPKKWNHKGKPEYVEILTLGGVEGVSMANNHIMDYGQEGYDDTVAAVESANLTWACDGTLGYYTVKGITIGIVSADEIYDGQKRVEAYLKDGIATLRESCDLVIACVHWGEERKYEANKTQIEIGHNCVDWGADMVIGNHPHVVQGVEKYNGKYIFYSLGNFCFGSNRNPSDKDCIIVRQTFTFIDGELQVDDDVTVIPCLVSSKKNSNNFQPTPASGDDSERILKKVNNDSRNFGLVFNEEGKIDPD